MKRLTKRDLVNGVPVCYPNNASGRGELVIKRNPYRKIVEKLKEYEDLEERHLVLRPQCDIGDTVYVPHFVMREVMPATVESITVHQPLCDAPDFILKYACGNGFSFTQDDFGKTVFLTHTEAENALTENMKGDE